MSEKMSTGVKVLIGLGLAAAVSIVGCASCVACAGAGAAMQQKKEKKAAEKFKSEKAIVVSADELVQAYEKNEIAANERYKDRKVRVTGNVQSITADLTDAPVVNLGTRPFKSVHVHDLGRATAAQLSKGSEITVVCRCDGEVIGMPVLRECSLD